MFASFMTSRPGDVVWIDLMSRGRHRWTRDCIQLDGSWFFIIIIISSSSSNSSNDGGSSGSGSSSGSGGGSSSSIFIVVAVGNFCILMT